ncbi:MAG: spore germination protein [Firmicutes bacterium]|nr:spore germination protein [Bacillota bacterium]
MTTNNHSDPLYPDHEWLATNKSAVQQLNALLEYAQQVEVFSKKADAAFRAGQWLKMLNSLKEEYQALEQQQYLLNPVYLTYANGIKQALSKEAAVNVNGLKAIFAQCSDLIIREFNLGATEQIPAALVMIEGMVDRGAINESILKPLLFTKYNGDINGTLAFIKANVLSVANIKEIRTVREVVDEVLAGNAILIIDKSDIALVSEVKGWESRSVEEPDTEAVVRGPREGFVETIRTNTALLRRKIKNPNLKIEALKVGEKTQTAICIAYIKGIVDERIVQELKKRLDKIEIDAVLESGYIENLIEDAPFSLFPTVGNSEKPDNVSAKLLEGRVAVFVDGTPFVLMVPYLFVEAFQVSEDYYSRPYYTTFIRWLRWFAFFTSTVLPALYVAITTYHQELLPQALLTSIATAQEGTPFPAVVEALLMQIIYEILREAGVRLPRPVGSAVSIVGALVIGEAAVTAGLVGAPMVVIVGGTAISSFLIPALSDVNALLRIMLIIMAGFSGIYGIILGFILTIIHQCSLRSFGVPYMSPLAPINVSDLKDVFVRFPWWAMRTRPRVLGGQNPLREKAGQKPKAQTNNN